MYFSCSPAVFGVVHEVAIAQAKDHPDLREQQRGQYLLSWVRLPAAPRAAAGDRMRRLEAAGHVTRFVTRTLCHAMTPGGRAETVVSPVGWSDGI